MNEYPSAGLTSDDVHPDVRARLATQGGVVYEFCSVLDMTLGRNVPCVQVRADSGSVVMPWTPINFVSTSMHRPEV